MNSFTFLLLFYLFLDKLFPDVASPRWRSNIQIRAENRSAAGRPGDDDRGLKSKNFKKRYTEGSNEDVKSGSVIVRQKGGMWSSEGGWVFANSGSNPPPEKKISIKFSKKPFSPTQTVFLTLPEEAEQSEVRQRKSVLSASRFVLQYLILNWDEWWKCYE